MIAFVFSLASMLWFKVVQSKHGCLLVAHTEGIRVGCRTGNWTRISTYRWPSPCLTVVVNRTSRNVRRNRMESIRRIYSIRYAELCTLLGMYDSRNSRRANSHRSREDCLSSLPIAGNIRMQKCFSYCNIITTQIAFDSARVCSVVTERGMSSRNGMDLWFPFCFCYFNRVVLRRCTICTTPT